MMSRKTGRGAVGTLLTAGLAFGALAAPARSQDASPPPSGTIDPSAPLDPMPDLGVPWPDMSAPDAPMPSLDDIAPPIAAAPTPRAPAITANVEQRYRVEIEGLDRVEEATLLRKAFDDQSVLVADKNRRANAAQLDRRAREDSDLLTELLRADGYYDAATDPQIEVGTGGIVVTLTAAPGARYRFASVDLPGLDAAGGAEATKLREAFAVKAGDPVVAEKVIAAGSDLKVALGELGFATASVGEQDIAIDHDKREARLVLPVTPGPIASFGQFRVSGSPPFSPRHVATIARFKTGDRFEQSDLDDLRRALIATGLIASAEVTKVPVDGGRRIDLDVKLEPAPFRTIAGEVGYGTGEGIHAEASWQHRNFFNPEGALTLRGVAGTQEQLAGVSLRFSNWKKRDQTLVTQVTANHVERAAYEARTFQLNAGVERLSNFIWQKKWTWSLGGELLASDERDTIALTGEERRRTFFIAALPATLGYDGTDSLLDPTKGFRLGGRVSPEVSLQGGTFGYVRSQVDASAYRAVNDKTVLAGRVRLGTITGASRDDIAPSRRFYAGGGGSVRGYAYQRLGSRDIDNDPIGGRSLAEFALEARVRLGNFGVVPFFDGGTLSTEALPDMKHWQFGTGIGLRYYSSFGPIRVDVGTPLNRQKGDGRVAVTVSLGQAF